MGARELERRWDAGRQLIEANGVTYNIYGDPEGRERPWLLDPIPLIIDAAEWTRIERAVAQRAMLLNSMLADLYGPQRLLKERLLPAGLVYSNPDFLRPCVGIRPTDGVFLHHFAVDLARSPNGAWWVIADRTQSPSGMGYALENRLVSARTLPHEFDQSQVRSLGHHFDQRRRALQTIGARRSANPRIVVLTPGPNNETYFEHSFLAHHWGFPLVEGADLTVRDNHVYLKTLSGLERVDVILRRTDDTFCDPLELRGDSVLGVAGLTQAARNGNVVLANALGSGLAESAAHMGFLPGLCQTLLGEPLRMPSVATWWCGQDGPRKFVRENIEQLVIKPVARHPGSHPYFPEEMTAAQREELITRIEDFPENYVAQEQVALSTAPARTESGLAPRHVVLRTFAFWDGEGFTVMPGGLTRVSTNSASLVVSMQMGGGSKDTWVLGGSGEPEEEEAGELAAGPTDLTSRVADNLFWMGRYAERVESGVRLVRALLPSLSSEADFGGPVTIESAIQLLDSMAYLPPEFAGLSLAQQRWHLERLLSDMVYDPSRSSGIGWNLKNVRRVAWPLKERFSQDTWRVLQDLEHALSSSRPSHRERRMVAQIALLDRVITTMSAFAGLMMENSTRGPGWRFLQIGKRLERAVQVTELLLATFSAAPKDLEDVMQTLLRIADSSITYRTRYLTTLRPEFVLELLMKDPSNPRSLVFQLEDLVRHLDRLPKHRNTEGMHVSLRLAHGALAMVVDAPLEQLCEGDMSALADLGRQIKGTLYDISDALSATYFSHSVSSSLAVPY
jgi:uncharacterized circularly permuted ATP-grasp superfamily protein